MAITPKKTKFKKYQKGRKPNKMIGSFALLKFGTFAFKAAESGTVSSRQIEATRRAIAKKIKKQGKIWVCIFSHLSKTKKPVEVRMGKGKGSPDIWIAKIKPGQTLYEIEGISLKLAQEIFFYSNIKFPLKCIFYDENL